ncbi:MAG: GTPase Era [Firmicutes bacterium ADurb.Bin193]|nr:MAG: GTPase Era [Firmicutes bacterium ADurb.Bin193]
MSYKSGFVSIVGRPNVGKSTLLNKILGEKIAAVSPKPQTTRNRITGVLTDDTAQIVFVDTPGIHKPKNKLGRFMVSEARQSTGEADIVLYMLDATDVKTAAEEEILQSVNAPTVFLVINKTDKVSKPEILPLISAFSGIKNFNEIIPISALTGDGVQRLVTLIASYLPEGPKFFPDDTLTDQPERQICAEFIREKMMRYLSDEIPYGTAVKVEEMSLDEQKSLTKIEAIIYCEKDSHKSIIIGKGGAMLKKVGESARRDIERFTGTKVFLRLWVKVRENWRNSDIQLKNFGYEE